MQNLRKEFSKCTEYLKSCRRYFGTGDGGNTFRCCSTCVCRRKCTAGKYKRNPWFSSCWFGICFYGGISISEGTALRDLGSNTLIGNLYTVYHDSEVIGVVSELKGSDNQVLSTYHETDDVALQSAADTDTPVAFYRDGNAVMVYDGDTLTNVSNGEAVDAAPEQADLQELEIADSDLAQYAMRATAMTYAKELPYFVDYCAKPSYDRYGNVSWACSIASKYNYKKQLKPTDAEALTTNEVFDRLVEMSGAQNPGGTASQIKDLLAVYRLRSTYQTGELSVEQVYKNLNQDNPVMIRMGVSTADAERFLEVDGLIFGQNTIRHVEKQYIMCMMVSRELILKQL